MEMRRAEKQVKDIKEIYDILRKCDTVTLGMNGGEAPYVIPMTFASALEDDKVVIYFHSALGGRKWEILNRDPHVCVEAHIYYKVVQENGGVTAHFESVIGTGIAKKVEEQADKVASFKLMMDQYNQSGFPVESCKGLPNCAVFKVVLDEVCGKRNL